jgi:flagellar basal body rod protein FlgC
MQDATLRLDVAANNVASVSTCSADDEQPSGVDLAAEMVTVLTAPIAYAANARVVRAARETGQSLLDALG